MTNARSIDMAIKLRNGKTIYQRLKGDSETELKLRIIESSIDWGKNGIFSSFGSEGGREVYYPAHMIESITTYSLESF